MHGVKNFKYFAVTVIFAALLLCGLSSCGSHRDLIQDQHAEGTQSTNAIPAETIPADYTSIPLVDLVHFEEIADHREEYENRWLGFYNSYGHAIQEDPNVMNDDPNATEYDYFILAAYNGDETFCDSLSVRLRTREDADKLIRGEAYLMYGYLVPPEEEGPEILECSVVDPEEVGIELPTSSTQSAAPTTAQTLSDPFEAPEDLSLCATLDFSHSSVDESMRFLEEHIGEWVHLTGVIIDDRMTDPNSPTLYAFLEISDAYMTTTYGSLAITGPGDSLVLGLSDLFTDECWGYLEDSGSIIPNVINTFTENIASDPGEASVSGLSFTADDVTANEPRFLKNYENTYVTVSEINVYTIYENYISGSVNVYFKDINDLFAVNEDNIITVSGYVSRDPFTGGVIITDAVLVSVDEESRWSW